MKGTGTDVPMAGREESPWGELPAAPSRRRAFIPAAVPSNPGYGPGICLPLCFAGCFLVGSGDAQHIDYQSIQLIPRVRRPISGDAQPNENQQDKQSRRGRNRHPSNYDLVDIQGLMRHHEIFLIPAVFGAPTDERHVDRRPNGRARGEPLGRAPRSAQPPECVYSGGGAIGPAS